MTSLMSESAPSKALHLKTLDEPSWVSFNLGLRGLLARKKCLKAISVPRPIAEYSEGVLDEEEKAHYDKIDEWDIMNAQVHHLLCELVANSPPKVQLIVSKHQCTNGSLTSEELPRDDGRSAYLELQQSCIGGVGADSAEGLLQALFDDTGDGDVDDMASRHLSIVHRLQNLPKITLEMMFKYHLLRLLRTHEKYDVVEDKCSDPSVSYDKANELIMQRFARLKVSNTVEEAHAASWEDLYCYTCGKQGLKKTDPHDCHPPSKGGKGKGKGKSSKGGASSSKGGRGHQPPGQGLSAGAIKRRSQRDQLAEAEAKLAAYEADTVAPDAPEHAPDEYGWGMVAGGVESTSSSPYIILMVLLMLGSLSWAQFEILALLFISYQFLFEGMSYWWSKCPADQNLLQYVFCNTEESSYAMAADAICSPHYHVVKMLLDSGASKVLHNDKSVFQNYVKMNGVIQTASKSGTINVLGKGDILMQVTDEFGKQHPMWIHGVWHVPEVRSTLFSVSAFRKVKGNNVIFKDKDYLESNGIKFPLTKQNDMYSITVRMHLPSASTSDASAHMAPGHQDPSCISKNSSSASPQTWHYRFSHYSCAYIKKAKGLVRGLTVSDATEPEGPCDACVRGNMKRSARPPNDDKIVTTEPLEKVHVDGMEGFEVLSIFGQFKGAYCFIDDYSRAPRCHGYKKKSDALLCFQEYHAHMRSKSRSIKAFVLNMKMDQAKELCRGPVKRWCIENNIKLVHSSPHEPRENAVAERMVGTVKSQARALCKNAGFPKNFWFLALCMVCHIMCFMPQGALGDTTPHERIYGEPPSVAHLRVPGCLTYFYNYTANKKNFHADRAIKGVLVGYDDISRSYKVYNLSTKALVRSSECEFQENVLPFKEPDVRATSIQDDDPVERQWGQEEHDAPLLLDNGHEGRADRNPDAQLDPTQAVSPAHASRSASPARSASPSRSASPVQAPVRLSREARMLQEQNSHYGERHYAQLGCGTEGIDANAFASLSSRALAAEDTNQDATTVLGFAFAVISTFYGFEPVNFSEATTCADQEQWRTAMDAEIAAMDRLNVFEYVPTSTVPVGDKVISCRWVFKIKPDKYKARLVIRGFMQEDSSIEGGTFSPTVKFVTVRLLFALAAMMDWTVQQMDVCNAFLNADLPADKPIYMRCVDGYSYPGFVIKLRKALYGLKNSPREWYKTLRNHLLSLGLVQCELDACLFMLVINGKTVLLVGCHVDDLIIVGVTKHVMHFKKQMTDKFKMDDLGCPDKCLGMDIDFLKDGSIQLRQTTYIEKMLHRFNLSASKEKATPMDSNLKLSAADVPKEDEDIPRFPYRELIMSLLYLALCTRPDITYAVKELSRFMVRPGMAMVKAAKRVLRYVGKTKHLGLLYHCTLRSVLGGLFASDFEHPVSAFSDASWADRLDDRKSTAGMVLLFNGTAIMWWSKVLRTVACSSQDAEFMALSDTSREVMFIRNLLKGIGYKLQGPTALFGDNNGSLALANNPCDHQKSKHLEVRYFFVRQKIEDRQVSVHWASTVDQLADGLTKALPQPQHERLFLLIMGQNPSVHQVWHK